MVQTIIDPVILPFNGDDTKSSLLTGGDPPSVAELAAKTVEDQLPREANPIAPAVAPLSLSLEDLKAILATVTKDLSQRLTAGSTKECKHLLNILLGKYKSGEVEAINYLKNGKNKHKGDIRQAQGKPANEGQQLLEHHPNQEEHPHNDALVVELVMEDFDVEQVLIDTGSPVNLMFLKTLLKMGISEWKITPKVRPLTGYDGEAKMSIGEIKLQVQARGITQKTKFIVIDSEPIYNAILGSPWILLDEGDSLNIPSVPEVPDNHRNFHPARQSIKAPSCKIVYVNIVESDPSRTVSIGSELEGEIKEEHITFLKSRTSTFVWSTKDMTGIPLEVTCHKFHTDPTFQPVCQKRRRMGTDRTKAVQYEVERLLKAGLIKEVQYPEWLANPVEVKKKNGKWRVCVDYTDLNRACPKDSYPLPHIDRLVEATVDNELLSFMDAFSGYNQIVMHKDDCEKTTFIKDRKIYCYIVMPFALKNAGATYDRLVNEMFAELLGVTMEVYIDDMLVKSLLAEDHIKHLTACFDIFDKCLPFYKLLRGNTDFHLDNKCETAFQELKSYLMSGAILAKPEVGEILYLSVSVSSSAVSGVLVRDDRGNEKPIFDTSKALNDVETRYPTLEKLALAVITAARKLRAYFQSHSIVVFTDHPLWTVLHSLNQSGQIAKWAIELSEYDVEYRSRPSLISQVLADFMTELSPDVINKAHDENWILYADGSSSLQGSGLGILLQSPTGEILEQSLRLQFKPSNNEAEYEALLTGLRLAKGIGARHMKTFSDSQLVVSQFFGEFEAKNERIRAYLSLVQDLSKEFDKFDLVRIPWNDNSTADALAALVSNTNPDLR
ncbi:Reverse transcriptase domain [Arabidopsis thaliana x Arabidopsis arenosa]|uniref:Reverse transcriptase domain n=1 Tax=Arabidopsis thaliana x Arabidopsis arenosa TaxID=1240361 RepID=A0A8T2FI92_9BRAS|nr:Reverse transcriptase domain [Arabidopsis thaliana x Arabidopsis arenosa]